VFAYQCEPTLTRQDPTAKAFEVPPPSGGKFETTYLKRVELVSTNTQNSV